ncbi:MAG TPA: protein kinase [Micromonosporaceae bacterium]|nr:protein kinase [Micromonosporaceae bacterium]
MSVGMMIGGRYELRAPLGRGGFGAVWRAHDVTLRRDVAVKVISFAQMLPVDRDAAMRRFWREAQSVAALNHPNVVTAHDFGVHGESAYLVMELLSGGSLADELAHRRATGAGPVHASRVIAIAAQICAGLAAAHAAGVVHRDLKPANIMTTLPTGLIKIVDFGIARDEGGVRLTQHGDYLGTLPYASPEQMQAGVIDGRSDLYSLACVLYELLSDRSPFNADTPGEWIEAHRAAQPYPLGAVAPTVPEGLARLIHQMLAKDPRDRPAGAAEVGARLVALDRSLSAVLETAGGFTGTARGRARATGAVAAASGGTSDPGGSGHDSGGRSGVGVVDPADEPPDVPDDDGLRELVGADHDAGDAGSEPVGYNAGPEAPALTAADPPSVGAEPRRAPMAVQRTLAAPGLPPGAPPRPQGRRLAPTRVAPVPLGPALPPYPVPTPARNGLATAGLVFGILPTPLFGLVFGLAGMSRAKRIGGYGRTRALVGVVLALVWAVPLAGIGIGIAAGIAHALDPGCRAAVSASSQLSSSLDADAGDSRALLTDLNLAIGQYNDAASRSHNPKIEADIRAVVADLRDLVPYTRAGKAPPAALKQRFEVHANALDHDC